MHSNDDAPQTSVSSAQDAERALVLEGVRHSYGDREALCGIDLEVEPGQLLALLGPNGSGKTTLFRIVSTLMLPSAGRVTVFGHDAIGAPDRVREQIGVVFQAPALDPQLTVRENLLLQAALYGLEHEERERRVPLLLERLGVADRADDAVHSLSGGLARRADLARGLIHNPRLLLLDEPEAALDPHARRDLIDLLKAERATNGTTIVMTTHLMEQAEHADRVVLLDRGRIVADGSPEALRSELERDIVRVRAEDPQRLAEQIRKRFDIDVQLVDGSIAIEHPRGDAFIPELVEAFRGEIKEVTLARPTLEDVFVMRTGHRLRSEDDGATNAATAA